MSYRAWWERWRKNLEISTRNSKKNVSMPERKLNKKISADLIEEFSLLKNHFNCFPRCFHKERRYFNVILRYFYVKANFFLVCPFLINHHQTHCCNIKEPKLFCWTRREKVLVICKFLIKSIFFRYKLRLQRVEIARGL